MDLLTGVVRDADAELLVSRIRQSGQPSLAAMGVDKARAYLEERGAVFTGPDVDLLEDHEADAGDHRVPVRVYGLVSEVPVPLVVYFHGGGYVVGSVRSSDAFCRRLVHAVPCVLVSVDYRLAPEHPFPAALDDAVAAIRWARERAGAWGADAERLVAFGDSAGATIATVATRRLYAAGAPVVARQILAYPGTSPAQDAPSGSAEDSWPLTDEERAWFIEQYVPDPAQRGHPDVAPLLADVTGLPPTTLLIGGCDPVGPDGIAYAQRLWSQGVSVDLHLYAGQIHGFLTFDESVLPRSREALGIVANAIGNV